MAGISIGYPKPKQSPFSSTQYAPSFVSIDSVTLIKDEDGKLVKVEYSSGREVEITYDDDGNILYTEDGKLARVEYSSGREVTITYDDDGNVLYTEDGVYRKTLVYDLDGEVVGMEVTKL